MEFLIFAYPFAKEIFLIKNSTYYPNKVRKCEMAFQSHLTSRKGILKRTINCQVIFNLIQNYNKNLLHRVFLSLVKCKYFNPWVIKVK